MASISELAQKFQQECAFPVLAISLVNSVPDIIAATLNGKASATLALTILRKDFPEICTEDIWSKGKK